MAKTDTLVILSPGFPVNEDDTTCLPFQQVFLRSLQQNYPNLNIVIIAFEYPLLRLNYSWFGIPVIAVGGKNRNRVFRLLNWVKVWHQLRELNKEHQIIGLLSFWVDECAFVGHYFSRAYKLRHFIWILGQDAKPGNRYFQWIKPRGDSLIALSDSLKKQVQKNYGVMPAHIITSGIDTALFDDAEPIKDIDILGVGSLISLKQYDVFVDVVKAISLHLPDVRAIICGKGPEKEHLLNMINQYGLEKNILLRNEVPHNEVLELMQRSRVFLHPSNYEGFAGVFLEALYAGAQVISFVKPMDEDITHHHVVNSVQEMQAKVFELLLDNQLNHTRVLPYPIQLVTQKMMCLFNYNEEAIPDILSAIASNERLS